MFERIFRALLLPCVLAIQVSGSPRFYQDYQEVRNQGHASCPSCRRERPDALVSWYSEPVRREFRVLEPEVDPWPNEQQFQSDPSFYDPYERAVRSRGGPFSSLRGASERENPFAFQRDINFDLAPTPTSPVRSLEDYQPRQQIPRSMSRPSYMKPNFYNTISRQTDRVPSNRYSNYGSSYQEPSFEGFRPLNSYEDANKKPYQGYQPRNYADRSFNVERPVVQPYPIRPVPNTRLPMGLRPSEVEQFPPVRREQPQNPPTMYTPQVRQNPYSPEQNVYKMARNSGTDAEEGANGGSFRDQMKEQKRQELERRQREEYEGQQRARIDQQMNEGNGGLPSNGRFDSNGGGQQDAIEKRDAVNENANVQVVGKSKVSWNRSTKSSAEVSLPEIPEKVTKPGSDEVTTKAVIAG